jgi:hypothetical protein
VLIYHKLKNVLQIFIGILLLIASLSLVFTTSGKKLQQTLFGSYVAEDATVIGLYIEEHKQRGKSDFQHWRVYLQVIYKADNIYYNGSYYEIYYEYKDAKMFVRNFIKAGEHLTIYRDPKKPQESVWHKEDELHLWLYIWFFLPLLTFSVILIIWGISEFFSKQPVNR